jgi:formylglycine-generating enzyme required for sulfatase activity
MVYVQAGEFITGSERFADDPAIGPVRTASVPAFYIDKTEMSNAQVQAVWPEHTFSPGLEAHPAVGLSWNQAVEVLSKTDKRLPTSLEWEKASRGTDGRIYPWGDEASFEGRAHVGTPRENPACGWGELIEVTALEDGASPYGLLNTLGNAWEWVGDAPTSDRPYHSIKGGAYGYSEQYIRLDNVSFEQPGAT